jgi:hypothetical protein
LCDIGGARLLNKYNGSLSILLLSMFPDFHWLPWKFTIPARDFWNDVKNQRLFMDWAAKQLHINTMLDWYNISLKVTTVKKLSILIAKGIV